MIVPNDTELQRMSDERLAALWRRRPDYPTGSAALDWIRLAKELRHRERFRRPTNVKTNEPRPTAAERRRR
jgi:hypothetical protein